MDVIRERKPLWLRVVKVLMGYVGAILVVGCFSFILLNFVGSEAELRDRLFLVKTPLLLWRITLYAVIAFFWFHRVRRYFLRHCTRRFQLYRLEIMMVCLVAMIEITCSRWGM